MDKATGDFFLVHQKEAVAEIQKLTDELNRMGKVIAQFGNELMKNPEKILFSNAPVGLGEIPSELVGIPTFNWDELPDKVFVARRIKALRRALARVAIIRRQLRGNIS